MNIDRKAFAGTIDHTYLKIEGGPGEITRICLEAEKYGFASVAIYPTAVPMAANLLRGTSVEICAALGFDLGTYTPDQKAFETRDIIEKGATEVDLVMNVAAAKTKEWGLLEEEFGKFREAAGKTTAKIILETYLLTDEEKIKVCELAKAAKLDFVKTSTGFRKGTAEKPGGATVHDVKLMGETVLPDVRVKAAGGIRTLDDALSLIEVGATRLGCSAGVQLIEAYDKRFG
ncbi:deoxyribose-phosphate aldolase [Candidatus Bipolaricaulota bacterium]|nr:deoxyribose-phosphate aldolase [Candidatus Bipolaricaulota bacterium]